MSTRRTYDALARSIGNSSVLWGEGRGAMSGQSHTPMPIERRPRSILRGPRLLSVRARSHESGRAGVGCVPSFFLWGHIHPVMDFRAF